jgi:hypothetical protein
LKTLDSPRASAGAPHKIQEIAEMGLLSRKNASSETERVRESLLHRRAALEAQRVAAERRLDEAVAVRRSQLVEGDLDNGQPTENIIGRLKDEKAAISDALAAIAQKLSEVEGKIAQDQDKAAREKASKRCQEQIVAARLVADRFAAVLEEATTAMQGLTNLSLTANTTASSLKIFGDQLSSTGILRARISRLLLRAKADAPPPPGTPPWPRRGYRPFGTGGEGVGEGGCRASQWSCGRAQHNRC